MPTYSNCQLAEGLCDALLRIATLEGATGLALPLSIANGGTASATKPAARLSFALPSIDLDAGAVINWALSDHFYNSISANKVYSITNNANGTSIQIRVTNITAGPITVTFTGVTFPISQANPFTIAAGNKYMVTIAQIANVMSGVFAGPYA